MIKCINGYDGDDIWSTAFKELQNSNVVETRNGKSNELIHVGISIENPLKKWVTVRNPIISIGYALAELVWLLSGNRESKIINFWNSNLPNYAGKGEYYPGAYGYRIQYAFGFNQLDRVFNVLKNNPDSRQAVIALWRPDIDMPYENGNPTSEDIPCNICSLIKVRNSKLEWTQIMRSNDLIMGLPYNLIQFTSLQEILASWLGVEVGTYNHISDSLHIYEKDKKYSISDRISYGTVDSLAIKKEDFSYVINTIYDIMGKIALNQIEESELLTLATYDTGYKAYNDILKIICTYAARKKGFENVKLIILKSCENELYKKMWNKWENFRKE